MGKPKWYEGFESIIEELYSDPDIKVSFIAEKMEVANSTVSNYIKSRCLSRKYPLDKTVTINDIRNGLVSVDEPSYISMKSGGLVIMPYSDYVAITDPV